MGRSHCARSKSAREHSQHALHPYGAHRGKQDLKVFMLTRRAFVAGATAALAAQSRSAYRVGITTNTRGGWEKDVFLSFREAHDAGYRYVESFIDYFGPYLDHPDELLKKTGDRKSVV